MGVSEKRGSVFKEREREKCFKIRESVFKEISILEVDRAETMKADFRVREFKVENSIEREREKRVFKLLFVFV